MESDQILVFAAGGAIVAVFVLAFWLIARRKKKIRETWKGFADAHGFELSPMPYIAAKGEIDGREVFMGTEMAMTAGGRNAPGRVVEFKTMVHLKGSLPQGLVAGKRGAIQGAGNVQTGDAKFDKRIWAECPDPGAGQAYLTPERREALFEVAQLGAVVMGPREGSPAMLARAQTGYKPQLEWLEQRLSKYLEVAARLDVV